MPLGRPSSPILRTGEGLYNIALSRAKTGRGQAGAAMPGEGIDLLNNDYLSKRGQNVRVLIADDDLTSNEILAALLEKNGYEVLTVQSGSEALRVMEQANPPRMVILDWLMPGLDGLDVCRRIRLLETDIPPYIIMLTVKDRKEDVVAGLDIGADDYLSKPYDPGELRARVDVGRRIVELQQNLAVRMNDLFESHERFRSFVENANDIIYTLAIDGVFCYVSPNWPLLLGHDTDEVVGQHFERFIHPDDLPTCFSFIEKILATGEKESGIEYRVRHKNGSWQWHVTNASIIHNSRGEFSSFLGVARNITDRKLADDKIKNLLQEKELLLKEVHHRIKNNMNSIMGLLTLQAGHIKDSSAIAALEEAKNRIYSMMLLYDKLYLSDSYTELSLKTYLSVLVDEIIGNFPNSRMVKVEKQIDEFILKGNILFPLGIIINELLTNIMKYAFTVRETGLITITASINKQHVIITIGDNGIGLPESVSFKDSEGFGLQLVWMLSKQIGCSVRIERGNGTRFVLEFDV